ncbi:MAG: hypothetical protein LBD20_06460 [Spirochaetaceae bacterium]|jgi:hypothetical protein|nr:hypothetical protein [Spirochaetaceae bacterium]
MNICDGWPQDFPKVIRFVDRDFANDGDFPLDLVKHEPDYFAAKFHADKEAAARLVEKFLSKDINVKQLASLKYNFPNAVIVPVRAEDNRSTNRIPTVLAGYMENITGIKLDTGIVQINKTGRSGSGGWHRLAFRPKFDGAVIAGSPYILIDDVFAHGGSLNELRLFIEKNGGRVVQMATLTLGRNGNIIALQPKTRDILLYKFGENRLVSFLKDKEINLYDGNYKNLTEPEARLIGNPLNLARGPEELDAARNRIITARREGNARVVQKTLRPRNTSPIKRPPRGFSR